MIQDNWTEQMSSCVSCFFQVVGPSDGSYYVIDYYGAVLHQVKSDNLTYIQPQYEEGYNYNYEL